MDFKTPIKRSRHRADTFVSDDEPSPVKYPKCIPPSHIGRERDLMNGLPIVAFNISQKQYQQLGILNPLKKFKLIDYVAIEVHGGKTPVHEAASAVFSEATLSASGNHPPINSRGETRHKQGGHNMSPVFSFRTRARVAQAIPYSNVVGEVIFANRRIPAHELARLWLGLYPYICGVVVVDIAYPWPTVDGDNSEDDDDDEGDEDDGDDEVGAARPQLDITACKCVVYYYERPYGLAAAAFDLATQRMSAAMPPTPPSRIISIGTVPLSAAEITSIVATTGVPDPRTLHPPGVARVMFGNGVSTRTLVNGQQQLVADPANSAPADVGSIYQLRIAGRILHVLHPDDPLTTVLDAAANQLTPAMVDALPETDVVVDMHELLARIEDGARDLNAEP